MSNFENISNAGKTLGSAVGGFLGNILDPVIGKNESANTTTTQSTEPTKASNTKAWIIGGIILVVVVIAGIVIYKISKKES